MVVHFSVVSAEVKTPLWTYSSQPERPMNFTTLDTPGSLFQQAVWQGIARVGYGETSHYQALALPAKRGCLP